MFLRFEENTNTGFVDDRVFQERSEPRAVSGVLRLRGGTEIWCPVVGLAPGNKTIPALARKVEDSGEGMCWLVYGGSWGLRLSDPRTAEEWGEPFLLLPSDGADLKFI